MIQTKPSLNAPGILLTNLREALLPIIHALAPKIKTLLDDKTYYALDAGIITGVAEDLGVVRYSVQLHHEHSLNPTYAQVAEADRANFVQYFAGRRTLQLSINVPAFGQMRVTCKDVAADGTINPANIQIGDVEGAVGTIWYFEAMDVITKLAAINMLAAPALVEKLEP